MKGKFAKIFGVVATLALLMGLFVSVAPVAAAPGENEWDEVDLPTGGVDTEIGVMAIAPDGTMFAAIFFEDDDEWIIETSTDGGFTWEETTLDGLYDDGDPNWGETDEMTPVDIVISPNWPTNKTVYVGCVDGSVFRLPNAGEDEPVLLIPIVDSDGVDLSVNGHLYDLDIFWDGSNNWLAAACDLDVFIFRDALFESWRDMEMATETDTFDWPYAVQVNFAPDFESSNLLWAVALEPTGVNLFGNELILTSTVSPGQWGNLVADVLFENQDGDNIWWTPFVDIAFPDDYDSDVPYLYVAIAEDDFDDEGNLWLVNADFVPGTSTAQPLFDLDSTPNGDVDLGTVEVSGSVILVKEWGTGIVWRSLDGGGTFTMAERSPADGGLYWGHLYMAPGPFDPDTGVCYATGLDYGGNTSGLARTTNGGYTWHHIAWIDATIDEIESLAFDPMGGSQPAFMITDGPTEGLWMTEDLSAKDVQWIRIGTNDSLDFWHMEQISYAEDGSALFMFVLKDWNREIWKSTDGGDTWNLWRNVPSSSGWVHDFVATNGTTFYAATSEGFWGTAAFGPANIIDFGGESGNSVAVFGDMVAVGGDDGNVWLSDDGGETFEDIATGGGGDVFVAFGPDGSLYAATADSVVVVLDDDEFVEVEDDDGNTAEADSFSGIWVAPDNALYVMGGTFTPAVGPTNGLFLQGTLVIGQAEFGTDTELTLTFSGTDFPVTDGDWVATEDVFVDTFDGVSFLQITGYDSVAGLIFISDDPADDATDAIAVDMSGVLADAGNPFDPTEGGLYVVSDTLTIESEVVDAGSSEVSDNVFWRLLLGEDGDALVWENSQNDDDIDGAYGLWGTSGSNFLWTVVDDNEIWALEDTLSGQVDLTSPANGSRVAGFTKATLEWEAMTGAEDYAYVYDSSGGTTDDTDASLTGLTENTTYDWKVRVVSPWTSRWSDEWSFTTADEVATPVNMVPVNGLQGAPLVPSFMWSSVSGATSYTFELSTDPSFATGVTSVSLTVNAYTWAGADLAYDQDYYWRVRAFNSSTGGVSGWCLSNFHTRTATEPPVTVTSTTPPDIHVTTTVPATETPAYIWIIIVIGAILTIAVIVLIVRTRRVV